MKGCMDMICHQMTVSLVTFAGNEVIVHTAFKAF
jgi:hypothetical protein